MRIGLAFALIIAGTFGCGNRGIDGSGGSGGGAGGSGGMGGAGGSGGMGGAGGSGGMGGGGGSGGSSGGTFSVSIGPIPVPHGKETTQCILIKMPTTVEQDIVVIQTALAPGSHHLIAYRSDATQENLTPTPCSSFEGVLNGEAPIFIADSAASTMKLPTGVSYHFPAGQMLRLEAHYINASTTTDIQGMGTVTFTPGAAMTYQPADIMMCGSVKSLSCQTGGGIAAGQPNVALPVGTYRGGSSVDLTKLKVFGLTSHEHSRGSGVKIWKASASSPTATQLYDNPDWSNPPLTVYDDDHLLSFATGEGLSWQCSYDTSAETKKMCFGESAANNEMCFIWAYYYPSVGRFISQADCWAN
jgi:hypothetical protein